jgi:two-component system phosphate regulon sensor histidine kinase PhoR
VEEQLPFEAELIARIGWLIWLRWLATIGTTLAILVGALLFPGVLPMVALLGVTAFIALYNLGFSLQLRTLRTEPSGAERLRHAAASAHAQIGLDLLALAALVHFTGGVENPLALFFVFHVIIASILLRPQISYLAASLAALLYAGTALLEYAGVLAHYHLPLVPAELYRDPLYLLAAAATLVLTLFLVAYLTTSISFRLRERDRELLESNLTCQVRSGELAELNEELRRLDAERTRFMVLVTHELRAPINTIYSALELARSGIASPEKTGEVLGRAQDRATDLLSLIGDLLDLSRVRGQTARPENVPPLQLAGVLDDVVEFMRVEAEEKDVAFQVDVAANLAPVRAPGDQMKLVWTNLLSNAVKYSQPGGVVDVALAQDEVHVIGQVRDTGIGIAVEDIPHVFDEFFRAGNARQVSPHGSGVGLATVRLILENWGGRIRVESEPGQGSAFTFILPRAQM